MPGLMRIPRYQTAIVASGPGTLQIRHDVPVPTVSSDAILVRTAAVALNPADAKMVDFSATVGAVSGYDFAGTVVALGSGIPESHPQFSVGDRVCGIVHGMNPINTTTGSFQEYISATADVLLHIPDSMSFEAASTLGTAIATNGIALVKSLGLSHRQLKAESADGTSKWPPYVLVHGGSTATGTMAIQFLRMMGYLPIATASPKNFELVKGRGAVEVFDYAEENVGLKIRTYACNALKYALDCVTGFDAMSLCYSAIGRAGGYYTTLEPYPERGAIRKVVTPDAVMALSIFGKRVALEGVYGREEDPEMRRFGAEWFQLVQESLNEGRIVNHPAKVMGRGWEQVLLGIDIMRKGGVSAAKLVYIFD